MQSGEIVRPAFRKLSKKYRAETRLAYGRRSRLFPEMRKQQQATPGFPKKAIFPLYKQGGYRYYDTPLLMTGSNKVA